MTTLLSMKADSSTRLSWLLIATEHFVAIFLWTPVLQGSPPQFPRLAILHWDWPWQVKWEGLLCTYTVATCCKLLDFTSCHTELSVYTEKVCYCGLVDTYLNREIELGRYTEPKQQECHVASILCPIEALFLHFSPGPCIDSQHTCCWKRLAPVTSHITN